MNKDKVKLETKEDYAKYYKRVIDGTPADGYVARVPELPGCTTHGNTPDIALKNSYEAIVAYLEMLEEDGEEFPLPAVVANKVKNFPLRIDVCTFETLKVLAKNLNLSLNEFIVRVLKSDGSSHTVLHQKMSPEIKRKVAMHFKEQQSKSQLAKAVRKSKPVDEKPVRRMSTKKQASVR